MMLGEPQAAAARWRTFLSCQASAGVRLRDTNRAVGRRRPRRSLCEGADMTPMTAREFMVTDLVTFAPTDDVVRAVQTLLDHRISGAPVVERDGRYLGVFSEKCAMQVLLDAAYEELPTSEVRAFMDVEAQTIAPHTHLLSIAQVFLLTPYRRLPVVEDGLLIGQVSRRDVLRVWMEAIGQMPHSSAKIQLLYWSELFEQHEAPLA
jgi:CBS domain-containing protein